MEEAALLGGGRAPQPSPAPSLEPADGRQAAAGGRRARMEAQAGRQAGPRARALPACLGGGVYGYADVDAAKSGSAKQGGWRVQIGRAHV